MSATIPAVAQNRQFPWHGKPPDCLLCGRASASGLSSARLQASTIRVARNEELVGQGGAAGYCYLVLSGCARTVRLMENGRRQIGDFLLAGDLFGWEALKEHEFGAEAVSPATLLRYPRHRLEALAGHDLPFGTRLYFFAARQLRASRERIALLGRKTAAERIATFLLEMQTRLAPEGRVAIELPMSRTDIADYLGLTIETICRGIASFRRERFIAVERARITIRDRRALEFVAVGQLHRPGPSPSARRSFQLHEEAN